MHPCRCCRSCRRSVQPAGRPPRSRFAPVLQPTIHSVSWVREAGDRASLSHQPLQITGHCRRRRGVMGIAGRRAVQLGLVVVEPRSGVADRAPERGERGGPADPRQQQIGAGVVAELDDRLAHVRDRHLAGREVLLGDGCVFQRDRPDRKGSWPPAAPRRDRPAPARRPPAKP